MSGCAPETMGIGPVDSAARRSKRAGIDEGEIDVIEMNEAFAVQVLACCRDLDVDPARLNRHSSAIALGHPLGTTGAASRREGLALPEARRRKPRARDAVHRRRTRDRGGPARQHEKVSHRLHVPPDTPTP